MAIEGSPRTGAGGDLEPVAFDPSTHNHRRGGRGRLRVVASLVVGVVCAVAVGVAGYAEGHVGGPNLHHLRMRGERIGTQRGQAAGSRRGYAQGFAAGRNAGYHSSYKRAYHAAFKQAMSSPQPSP